MSYSRARAALGRAEQLQSMVLDRWPQAWRQMDHFRAHPPTGGWPDWCLLPMAAAVAVATQGQPVRPGQSYPIAATAALDAWRYARSVYLYEPHLASTLRNQIPDAPPPPQELTLPEWCVLIADPLPTAPGSHLFAHLEYDANTDRAELRLLLDPHGRGGLDSLLPVPVYLDRETLTDALGDFVATARTTQPDPHTLRRGQNVRGGPLNADIAAFADQIDSLVPLVTYLARPEADIHEHRRPGVTPTRAPAPVTQRRVWLVGHQTQGTT